ncbi:AraC family transcriptional regulator [Haliangium sp.]|uniref:AraC family transcriptional regulator n=1 Tax=Haliangium sp. TaxID=2663208 RepID=UPI003D10FAF8
MSRSPSTPVEAVEIDVDRAPAPSFGLAEEMGERDTGWHTHNRHQLLYAVAGSLHLEVAAAQWLLPPQRAGFIPAGVDHRVRCRARVALRTVYLAADAAGLDELDCCVFPVTPLAREMLVHATRWGARRAPGQQAVAEAFFHALGLLAREWIRAEVGLRLPRPGSPDLTRAFDYALSHLEDATMGAAARAAGVSARTLARRFQAETGLSWRSFLRTARILRAMDVLAQPGVNVTEAAFAVGFENLAGFSKSFRELTGESPREYQKRVT